MPNICDYLEWRGDLSFAITAFNTLDAAILAQLSYFDFSGIVPAVDETAPPPCLLAAACSELLSRERFISRRSDADASVDEDRRFLTALSTSRRFLEVELHSYVQSFDLEEEKQFSALCCTGLGKDSFVAFRGTDGSLLGWKEDFNMSYADIVPAQQDAQAYLEVCASRINGLFYVGGHSKGGNLAQFAAVFVSPETQARLLKIYNFDGPGLKACWLESAAYQAVSDRFTNYLPEESLIGILLESSGRSSLIKSKGSGIWQHSLYNWQSGRDSFIKGEERTRNSVLFDKTVRNWLSSSTAEEREIFTDTIYDILRRSHVTHVRDLNRNWAKQALKILWELHKTDNETQKAMTRIVRLFILASISELRGHLLPPET